MRSSAIRIALSERDFDNVVFLVNRAIYDVESRIRVNDSLPTPDKSVRLGLGRIAKTYRGLKRTLERSEEASRERLKREREMRVQREQRDQELGDQHEQHDKD